MNYVIFQNVKNVSEHIATTALPMVILKSTWNYIQWHYDWNIFLPTIITNRDGLDGPGIKSQLGCEFFFALV